MSLLNPPPIGGRFAPLPGGGPPPPGGGPPLPGDGPPPPGGGPLLPRPPLVASSFFKNSSPSMISSTFSRPLRLSAAETRAIAAERCAGVISFRLMPPRGMKPVGKLDQRARCCSSSKEYRTLCRCFSLSVERKVFAALTIFAVAVCAEAAVTDSQTAANAPTARSIFIEKTFILISWSFIMHTDSSDSEDHSVYPLLSSTLMDGIFLLSPTSKRIENQYAVFRPTTICG